MYFYLKKTLADFCARSSAGRFSRNVSILAGSVAAAQGVGLLVAPILTRIYSVADFGNLQIYLSVLLFALIASCGRYELGIILPGDERSAADLTVLCLLLVLASSVIIAIAALIVYLFPVALLGFVGIKRFLWLMPVSVLGGGFYAVLAQWTLRQKDYAQVARSKIAQGITMGVTQVALGASLNLGASGLLVGDAVGRFCGIWSFARTAWANHSKLFRGFSWEGLSAVAYRYRRFPQISVISAAVNSAGGIIPPLIIAGWFSPEVLGWYSLTDRVLAVPTALVGAAISQVYTVDAARLVNEDAARVRRLIFKTMRSLAILGIIPFFIIFCFGPAIFGRVFGPAWKEAGRYAQFLAPMHYISFIVWPIIPTLNILERQSWQFVWDAGRFLLTFSAIALPYYEGWRAESAIGCYSAAMAIGYIVHPLLSLRAISHRAKLQMSQRAVEGRPA